ncbi:hypothetical protein CH252_11710 [Rhodococcus sp. 06-1477-1B]|nr:hypothetical protein CH252_11710 [Rhodococcus sp. 06-1477-1B]
MSPDAPGGDPAAALADRIVAGRGRAWLVEGVPGAGATRLSEHVADRLGERGFDVVRTSALPELSGIPLAALLPLLSRDPAGEGDDEPARRLQRVTARLAGTAKTTVLLIDAAAWLDDVSAAAVHQLVRSYGVRVLMTARIGQLLPAPLRRLGDEGLLERVGVPALSEDEAVALLDTAAGGRVAPPSLVAFLERAGAHPLFLHLLVEQSRRSGLAREIPLGIDLGRPSPPRRLRDLVAEWAELAGPAHEDALALLAVSTSLPRDVLDEGDVAALVEAGLAIGTPDRVQIASPLVGEVISGGMPPARRRETAALASVRLAEHDDPRSRLTRIALASEGDTPPSTEELASAARTSTALGHHALAVELGSRALALAEERREPVPIDAVVLRGESLWLLGRHDDADLAMDAAVQAAPDDAALALAASRAGSYWSLRREDPARAYRVTGDALERIVDPQAAAFLRTSMTKWQIMLGDLPRDASTGGRLGADGAGAAVASLDPLLSAVLAACLSGDTATARAGIAAGRPHARPALAVIRHAAELFDYAEAVADCADANLPAAREAFLERSTHRTSEAVGIWTLGAAWSAFLQGDADSALVHAREATHQLAWRDLLAFEGLAIGTRATVSAWLGRPAEAEECLARLTPGMRDLVITDLEAAQAESWLAFRAGDPSPAAAVERAVEAAEGRHHDWWLALAALSAIRMGQPSAVCAVLRRLPPHHTGASVRLILAYGEALELGDPAALVSAAQGLESAGYLAAAHDAARQALALGAHPHAATAARRARVIVTRVGAVLSPSPIARSDIADLLTAREWAVASAAATRARNREIAESLGLSHRTVENHLAAVYRKLGVSGRDELREVVTAAAIA